MELEGGEGGGMGFMFKGAVVLLIIPWLGSQLYDLYDYIMCSESF